MNCLWFVKIGKGKQRGWQSVCGKEEEAELKNLLPSLFYAFHCSKNQILCDAVFCFSQFLWNETNERTPCAASKGCPLLSSVHFLLLCWCFFFGQMVSRLNLLTKRNQGLYGLTIKLVYKFGEKPRLTVETKHTGLLWKMQVAWKMRFFGVRAFLRTLSRLCLKTFSKIVYAKTRKDIHLDSNLNWKKTLGRWWMEITIWREWTCWFLSRCHKASWVLITPFKPQEKRYCTK